MIFYAVLVGAAATVITFLCSLILALAWNAVIPGVFHLSTITPWQAFLLLVISHLLFGHVGISRKK